MAKSARGIERKNRGITRHSTARSTRIAVWRIDIEPAFSFGWRSGDASTRLRASGHGGGGHGVSARRFDKRSGKSGGGEKCFALPALRGVAAASTERDIGRRRAS